MAQGGIRFSTRLFFIGLMLIAVGGGLFYWGMTADLQPAQGVDPSEPMRVIGQVSGAVVGVGVVIVIIALIRRTMGK
jgi:hypothetical protein